MIEITSITRKIQLQKLGSKGNQPWIFMGRSDAEAEAALLWSHDDKSRLIGKDPDAGKDWRQEEKGTTEDEMVGWHHRLSGQEFEQTPGKSEGRGSLVLQSMGSQSQTWLSDWTTSTSGHIMMDNSILLSPLLIKQKIKSKEQGMKNDNRLLR